jgi:nodulation protein A
MTIRTRIIPESSITPEEDAAIRAALCLCFPNDAAVFSQTRAWHGSFPAWSVVFEQQQRIIAHVGVVERKIRVGLEEVRAGGIQNALIVPEHRKKHLFRQIVSAAMEEARRRNLDLGILFCTANLVPLYAAIGWQLLNDRRVIRLDENRLPQPLPAKNATMCYPLHRLDIPPGDIHLQGNDW